MVKLNSLCPIRWTVCDKNAQSGNSKLKHGGNKNKASVSINRLDCESSRLKPIKSV